MAKKCANEKTQRCTVQAENSHTYLYIFFKNVLKLRKKDRSIVYTIPKSCCCLSTAVARALLKGQQITCILSNAAKCQGYIYIYTSRRRLPLRLPPPRRLWFPQRWLVLFVRWFSTMTHEHFLPEVLLSLTDAIKVCW